MPSIYADIDGAAFSRGASTKRSSVLAGVEGDDHHTKGAQTQDPSSLDS
jgi:hypothetical protein